MDKEEILELCSTVLDSLTVLKGYIHLGSERANVDYSIVMLQELNTLEQEVNRVVDILLSGKD